MFSRWPSMCLSFSSVRSPYIRPSALRFRSITKVFINGFHSNFAYAFVLRISLGIVNGQISLINLRVMALVNGQELGFDL